MSKTLHVHTELYYPKDSLTSEPRSFYTINGYIFSNNPTYEMCLNDKVIWYVNAYGGASHVFHLHGNGFAYNGINNYATSKSLPNESASSISLTATSGLNDGVGKTLYTSATGGGLWQVICHVSDHQTKGMVNNYEVYLANQCPLKPLGS